MLIAFIAVGGLGLLLLLISMTLGEIFDLFDGILSTTALGVATTLFGATGAIVSLNGGPAYLAYILAAALGVIGLVGMALVTRKMTAMTDVQPHEVIGLTGVATTAINSLIGKVQLSHPDEINQRLAFATSTIDQGTSVTVVEIVGERIRVSPTSELNGA